MKKKLAPCESNVEKNRPCGRDRGGQAPSGTSHKTRLKGNPKRPTSLWAPWAFFCFGGLGCPLLWGVFVFGLFGRFLLLFPPRPPIFLVPPPVSFPALGGGHPPKRKIFFFAGKRNFFSSPPTPPPFLARYGGETAPFSMKKVFFGAQKARCPPPPPRTRPGKFSPGSFFGPLRFGGEKKFDGRTSPRNTWGVGLEAPRAPPDFFRILCIAGTRGGLEFLFLVVMPWWLGP